MAARPRGGRASSTTRRGLLEELLELLFEVVRSNRAFGTVGDGLFAEVIEGEGPGRGEATAPGLIQDEPHQLERHLRIRLALLQAVPPSSRKPASRSSLWIGRHRHGRFLSFLAARQPGRLSAIAADRQRQYRGATDVMVNSDRFDLLG